MFLTNDNSTKKRPSPSIHPLSPCPKTSNHPYFEMSHLLSSFVELFGKIWSRSLRNAVFAFSRAQNMVFQLLHAERWGTKCTAWSFRLQVELAASVATKMAPKHGAESIRPVPHGEDKSGTPQRQAVFFICVSNHSRLVGKAFIFQLLDRSFCPICSQLAKRVNLQSWLGFWFLVSWQERELCHNWVP